MATGGCACGAVRFETKGALRKVMFCHCTQCQKHSGHFWAATSVPNARLKITGAEALGWYQSSDRVRRGFCRRCGSALFYQPQDQARMSIAAGAFDPGAGLIADKHIFVGQKGGYYQIKGGLPQCAEWEDRP